jgi:hypothetical protein
METAFAAMVRSVLVCAAVLLAACGSNGPKPVATVAVEPRCTLLLVDTAVNPKTDVALVSERTDPSVEHGFTRFRALGGPRGNPAVGFTADVYGISEAWSRNTSGSVVYRAQAHPASRPTAGDFQGSAWSLSAQDAAGAWSPVFAAISATRSKDDQDDVVTAGAATPQLMAVGVANPEVFGCAGARSEDKSVRSTWLIRAAAPNAAARTSGSVSLIQDLLNGDDRFVPGIPGGPLTGPPPTRPPKPKITGRPGDPVREGSVRCAMRQLQDDVATRELHMLAISNGVLYHSMASDFGPTVTDGGAGITFDRFRAVSPWADVGQALGGGFGKVVDAAIVAHPSAVSVFFVDESAGRFRLWHAVRFSSAGTWRAADNVLALNGGRTPGDGVSFGFRVAAGRCPVPGKPEDSELVYVMWDNANRIIWLGRFSSSSQEWVPGVSGNYSPLFDLSKLLAGTSDTSRQNTIQSMAILTRPFRDDATPAP